ncbi:MAG: protein translocase subunit SecF [Candidatus Sericytochromatia bacterium]|nr:protein translocase subunit SecF [Candidatus Sericytochromatia bacterium]
MRFEDSDFNYMNKKPLWFGISALLLVPGIAAILYCLMAFGSPLRLGIDFTGGTLAQLTFEKTVTAQEVKSLVSKAGHPDSQVQIADNKTALIRTKAMSTEQRQQLLDAVQKEMGAFKADRFETVGPTIGKELLLNSMSAVALTLLGIIGYVSFRYQFDFAMCAIAALLHDVVFILGVFAILGIFLHVEVDSLFVTAVLTVVGFSVHDTIIIYDRIRENMRTAGKRDTFDDVANRSIKQTLARSINTSLTVCLTLLAMLLFGGETVRWFVLAMLLGIVAGTYSSIFNASQLLSVWRMMGVKRAA